ncbi:MAG: YdcF family protein [Patescibacteria group bacterium]|jgi:uncharacterized SAM-binding protein YcdF (DUF218 family)
MPNQPKIDALAQIIWDYHLLHHQLKPAEAILVLGSHDLRIAEYAAQLFLQGYAPLLICSGGLGHLTKNIWTEPEADQFAKIAIKLGMPQDKILIENQSTNTGENIIFTRQLLAGEGLKINKFIVVQKPYMERRAYATFKKVWPEPEIIVTSPPISFAGYPDKLRNKEDIIGIMVGDLQRIKEYPAKGFQIPQEIPTQVWQAYEELVKLGYTKHLIK